MCERVKSVKGSARMYMYVCEGVKSVCVRERSVRE